MGRLHPPRQHFLDVPLANGYASHTLTQNVTASHSASRSLPSVTPLHLTSQDESTRVQLQKQRLREQHHAIVVSQRIPGLKTSAAFFASLRTNLRLNASPPSSPISTPPSMTASANSLPPPSPLSAAMDFAMDQTEGEKSEDPLAGVPELNTYLASDEEDKTAALRLVADSVAQMRQTANSALIYHPLNLTIVVGLVSLAVRFMMDQKYDKTVIGTTCAGLVMILLAGCRYLTQSYIFTAEEITWTWLGQADVIVTKFGDEVIGTVIIDWVSGEPRQKRKKAWRGEIKGWTVRLKYRQKGVGTALLEEAIKESKKKSAEIIEFADNHANSIRILPSLYNGKMDKRDRQAREMLQDLLEASPCRNRRKRGGSS